MVEQEARFGQHQYVVRFDWGASGARAMAADVSVIVDVLSFSTSVCVAVERGMRIYPYPWKDARAAAFARERDAVLAVGRLEALTPGAATAPSLSPASLFVCSPAPRVVLPSPNGSTIAAALMETGSRVAIGCLRNADAVAEWLAPQLDRGDSVAIIAAGERWSSDGTLRPALEDQLGAGAILSTLSQFGYRGGMSPEAWVAAVSFRAVHGGDLTECLEACVGACELADRGFRSDVDVAGSVNSSRVVPVLVDGAFECA